MWMLCFECSSYCDHIRISPSCDIKQIKEYNKGDKISVQSSLHPESLVHCPQYLKLWNDLYEHTPLETYVRKEKKNSPLKGNIKISLTDTLQVWIPKMIFSAFITVPSSKLRMAWTTSSYLNMSQHIHTKFNNQHLLQVIIYNLFFILNNK